MITLNYYTVIIGLTENGGPENGGPQPLNDSSTK